MAVRGRLIWAGSMLSACAALLLGYAASEGFARFVADRISRPAAAALTAASGRAAVPLAEIAAIVGGALFALALLRALYRAARQRPRALSHFFEGAALAASALLLTYALLWSAQLYAPKRPAPAARAYGTDELSDYCGELIADLNALGAAASDVDTVPHNVKFARYPELMRALGMGGVYVPWTGETIVSGLEPNLSLPFIAAHESAHAQGYALEDEANYIAYLTCMDGGVRSRYSGAMYAMYYCMEALHDRDAAAWNRAREAMSATVRRDYYRLNGLRTVPAPERSRWGAAAAGAFGRAGRYGDVVDLLMADRG